MTEMVVVKEATGVVMCVERGGQVRIVAMVVMIV
jgi:hypothetical protein